MKYEYRNGEKVLVIPENREELEVLEKMFEILNQVQSKATQNLGYKQIYLQADNTSRTDGLIFSAIGFSEVDNSILMKKIHSFYNRKGVFKEK